MKKNMDVISAIPGFLQEHVALGMRMQPGIKISDQY